MSRRLIFVLMGAALATWLGWLWFVSGDRLPQNMPHYADESTLKPVNNMNIPRDRGKTALGQQIVKPKKNPSGHLVEFIPGLEVLLTEALKEVGGRAYPEISSKRIVQISEAASICAAKWNSMRQKASTPTSTVMSMTPDLAAVRVVDARGTTSQFDPCPGFDVKTLPIIENLLESAARAGEPEAMAAYLYAGSILSPFILGDSERLRESLKDLGVHRQDIGEKMIDAGYKEAFTSLASMHEEGRFVDQNFEAAYSYLSAYVMAAQRAPTRRQGPTELPLEFYEKQLNHYRSKLDISVLDRANSKASDLYARCCVVSIN
jgi:hypothetical protein